MCLITFLLSFSNAFSANYNQTNLETGWSRVKIKDLTFSILDQPLTLFHLLRSLLKNSFFYMIRAIKQFNTISNNNKKKKKRKKRREYVVCVPSCDILSLAASGSFWLEPICSIWDEKTKSGETMMARNRTAKCIIILCHQFSGVPTVSGRHTGDFPGVGNFPETLQRIFRFLFEGTWLNRVWESGTEPV